MYVLIILVGFYRGIAPGITGSLATGATYFGVIESTKKWIEDTHPGLGGYWSHFIAGALGKLSRAPKIFDSILFIMLQCEFLATFNESTCANLFDLLFLLIKIKLSFIPWFLSSYYSLPCI